MAKPCAQIAALDIDPQMILDDGEFWAAVIVGDGTYMAIWIDEDGLMHKAVRKSGSGAIKLARDSWGR